MSLDLYDQTPQTCFGEASETAVAYYRLYLMKDGSRIDRFHEFELAEDEAATARAEMFRSGRAMELWAGARLIKRWEPLTMVPKS